MPACEECNNGTSTADLIAAIMSRWDHEPSEAEQSDHRKLSARLRTQAPEIHAEWIASLNLLSKLKGVRHLRSQGVRVPDGAGIVAIGDRTVRYLNLFAHKATLALYFEHFREPLTKYGAYYAVWRSKEDYSAHGIPTKLLDLMPKYATLQQGAWDSSEVFEYRHDLNSKDGLLGFFARLRRGLFVAGFAVRDAKMLPAGGHDWQTPCDLLTLMDSARFLEKR